MRKAYQGTFCGYTNVEGGEMIYTIEIVGLLSVEADSKEEAIGKVKQMFEDEELTVNDLDFVVESEYEE